MMQNKTGTLYIVATPIGNLGDITFRAIDILKSVKLIAAEDTRHTKKLLTHYDISNELISCYEYSDQSKIDYIVNRLKAGDDVALVSDAGTPSVSDPGRYLVANVRKNGISVYGIPGPCAAVNAYSVSGFDDKRFVFWGFLPDKTSDIKKELNLISKFAYPVIIYVSPHKVIKTLTLFNDVLHKHTSLTVLREMTKIHEEYFSGTIYECLCYFSKNNPRGEFVFIVKNFFDTVELSEDAILDMIKRKYHQGIGVKDICRQISEETGVSKNLIYKIAVESKEI